MPKTSPTGSEPLPGLFRHWQGFTLIETLVVISLIALLAAVMAPNMIPTPNNQLRQQAADVVSALRSTRLAALRSGQAAALSVDTRKKTYREASGRTTQLDQAFGVQLTTAERELTGGESGAIRFFPDGSSTGGRVSLQNANLIRHIDVTWLTGRIRVFEESR